MKNLLFAIMMVALGGLIASGCSATGEKAATRTRAALLDSLRGGMSMEEVIGVLGEPTTLIEIRPTPFDQPYHELTYVNTLIDPGVVQLHFQPGLFEILLDTKPYRRFAEPRANPGKPAR